MTKDEELNAELNGITDMVKQIQGGKTNQIDNIVVTDVKGDLKSYNLSVDKMYALSGKLKALADMQLVELARLKKQGGASRIIH